MSSPVLIQLKKSEDTYAEYINLLQDEDDDEDVDISLQTGLLHSYGENSTTLDVSALYRDFYGATVTFVHCSSGCALFC